MIMLCYGPKTINRSNKQKNTTLHVQYNILYISLPLLVLQRGTSWLHFLWRKCRTCSQGNLVLVFLFAFSTSVCLWYGRVCVRSREYKSLPKYLGCIDSQIFLPMVLCCACLTCVRAPLQISKQPKGYVLLSFAGR